MHKCLVPLIALIGGIYVGIWSAHIPGLRSIGPRPAESLSDEGRLQRIERFLNPGPSTERRRPL